MQHIGLSGRVSRCTRRTVAFFWSRRVRSVEIAFRLQRIPFVAQQNVELADKGELLKHTYAPDFVCFNENIVAIKAVSSLAGEHRDQGIRCLLETGMELGLLVNFRHYPGP